MFFEACDIYGVTGQFFKGQGRLNDQSSCDFLIVLYFGQNNFTPLYHKYIQLCKNMKNDDWKTLRTSKTKGLLVKVSNGCFPIELCVCHFL